MRRISTNQPTASFQLATTAYLSLKWTRPGSPSGWFWTAVCEVRDFARLVGGWPTGILRTSRPARTQGAGRLARYWGRMVPLRLPPEARTTKSSIIPEPVGRIFRPFALLLLTMAVVCFGCCSTQKVATPAQSNQVTIDTAYYHNKRIEAQP